MFKIKNIRDFIIPVFCNKNNLGIFITDVGNENNVMTIMK